jgi:hypothetical protein
MALSGTGRVAVIGSALYVTVHGRTWGLSIQRIDGQRDPAFDALHGQPVSDADVRALLPGWQNLRWSAPKTTIGFGEACAYDEQRRVCLIYPAAGDRDAIIAEFAANLA